MMQSFLSNVSAVVTEAIEWMGLYMDTILEYPALFTICVGMPLCFMAVNLLNRLIRL